MVEALRGDLLQREVRAPSITNKYRECCAARGSAGVPSMVQCVEACAVESIRCLLWYRCLSVRMACSLPSESCGRCVIIRHKFVQWHSHDMRALMHNFVALPTP